MDNKPKKSDLVHQTVSRQEAHGLGMSLIETAHSVKNGALTKSREHFLCLFVLYKKETSFSASVDKAFFLQPAKTAAMCIECHDYARPPPTILPFLLHKTYLQNKLITCRGARKLIISNMRDAQREQLVLRDDVILRAINAADCTCKR